MTRIIFYVAFNTPIPLQETGPGIIIRESPEEAVHRSPASPGPGTYGSTIPCTTLMWEDALPASMVVSAINTGSYRFPLIPQPGPVFAIQHGEVVFATRPASISHPEISIGLREKQILTLLAEGKSLQQVGYIMQIKPRTLAGYLTQLKQRLGAGSREQMVARAIALGLCHPSLPD